MRPLRRFFRRFISPATAQRDEERLRAEIEEHLALQTAENLRSGLAPADARREATLKFGAVEAAPALLASLIPAIRASLISPLDTLRAE